MPTDHEASVGSGRCCSRSVWSASKPPQARITPLDALTSTCSPPWVTRTPVTTPPSTISSFSGQSSQNSTSLPTARNSSSHTRAAPPLSWPGLVKGLASRPQNPWFVRPPSSPRTLPAQSSSSLRGTDRTRTVRPCAFAPSTSGRQSGSDFTTSSAMREVTSQRATTPAVRVNAARRPAITAETGVASASR